MAELGVSRGPDSVDPTDEPVPAQPLSDRTVDAAELQRESGDRTVDAAALQQQGGGHVVDGAGFQEDRD